jgi:hypothetical protein
VTADEHAIDLIPMLEKVRVPAGIVDRQLREERASAPLLPSGCPCLGGISHVCKALRKVDYPLRELVDIGHFNFHSFTVRVEIAVLLPRDRDTKTSAVKGVRVVPRSASPASRPPPTEGPGAR